MGVRTIWPSSTRAAASISDSVAGKAEVRVSGILVVPVQVGRTLFALPCKGKVAGGVWLGVWVG